MERYSEYKDSGNYIVGSIPKNWGMVRLKFICTGFNNGTTANQIDYTDNTVPVTRIETISNGVVNFNKVGFVEYSENLDSYKLNKGDVLLSHINSYERIGNSAVYDSDVDLYHGMNLLRLSPKENINNKYLYIYLKSLCFILQMQRKCKPAINQVSVPAKVIKNIFITFPPLAEQEKIVSYLESKTSKIDAYVADKEKEILLLQELKQETIAEAVTKGLNPNVKMKEYNSLISSQYPEHWKIMRNKTFLSLTGEKVGNRANKYTLLSLTTKGVIVRDLESGKGKFPKDFDTYQIVKKDDLVFCLFDIDETPRTVGLVDTEGMITGAYTALKVNQSIALPEYVYRYYLCVDDIKALKPYYSGLRKTVRADKFLQLYLPLPSLDEQRAIVSYIEEKCQKIDTLITELQAEIDYLKEYKQRLIADVVTGQVNVQNEMI